MVPWAHPTQVLNSNGISIGSAVFAGLTSVTDRQTDRQTDHATRSLTIDRIYVRSTAMWSNNHRRRRRRHYLIYDAQFRGNLK